MKLLGYVVLLAFGVPLVALVLLLFATFGVVTLGILAGVLWMCFVYLTVDRVAAGSREVDRRAA